MDDRQVEEQIRHAFPADVPADLRRRALGAARQESLERQRRGRAGARRWAAAVAAGVLWVLFAAGEDSMRAARMERLALSGAPPGVTIASAVEQIRLERESIDLGGVL